MFLSQVKLLTKVVIDINLITIEVLPNSDIILVLKARQLRSGLDIKLCMVPDKCAKDLL